MGYDTKFRGQIDLSRKLTLAEAKTLCDLNEMDRDESKKTTGFDAYMQWVPAESLDAIVWDGNEKFYESGPLMRWLCGWLIERGIVANGTIYWSGEDFDSGTLTVADNELTESSGVARGGNRSKPLTSRRLGEMSLEQLSKGGAV